jgi:hypothetical protein
MKKITLNQKNFKPFFSPVGPLHSHHEEHIWPYDYVDRGSDTLLVTIGDSWTWGSGISGKGVDATNITAEQNDFRLDHLYGNIISQDKNWNWINLGFYAMGNQWMVDKVLELRALLPLLEFKEIIVMINFTSTGRWFATSHDSLTDYKTFFQTNKMTAEDDYENFLLDLNRKMLRDINLLTNSETRVKLLVGTNAVDHCGFDIIEEKNIIPLPWYRLLSKTDLDGTFVDMDSIKSLANMENLLYNSDQKIAFQKWMIEKIKQAEKQKMMLNTMDHVAQDKVHPDHNGHKLWAEYILKNIIK